MIRELEPAFEASAGYSAMEVLTLQVVGFSALYHQDITFLHDIQIAFTIAGYGHLDGIVIVPRLDDVISRPGIDCLQTLGIVEKIEDPVETNARTVERGEVEFVSHNQNLRKASWTRDASETCVSAMPASSSAGADRFGCPIFTFQDRRQIFFCARRLPQVDKRTIPDAS
jgi:hypothetical protein